MAISSQASTFTGQVATTGSTGVCTFSSAITLAAGSDRRALVMVSTESEVLSVTFGGVSMSKVTDGTRTAELGPIGTELWSSLWECKEADLPSNGAQTVVATLDTTAFEFAAANMLILEGVDQGDAVEVRTGSSTSSDTVSTSVQPTVTSNATQYGVSCPTDTLFGTYIFVDFDTVDDALGDELSGRAIRMRTGTWSSDGAKTISASQPGDDADENTILFALFDEPSAGGELSASAAFASGPASASASAEAAHQASASFVSGAASAATQAESAHQASAAFVSGAASMTASAVSGLAVTAEFASGPASASASAESAHQAAASFASGPAAMATSGTVTGTATVSQAAFASGPATMSASASVESAELSVTAAFVSGPSSASARLNVAQIPGGAAVTVSAPGLEARVA